MKDSHVYVCALKRCTLGNECNCCEQFFPAHGTYRYCGYELIIPCEELNKFIYYEKNEK